MEMLQQATGLSPAMLSHALKPLTEGEKGILTYTGSSEDPMKGEKSEDQKSVFLILKNEYNRSILIYTTFGIIKIFF